MFSKKNPRVDLEKYRFLFFLIGLVISLGLVIFLFNIKTYQKAFESFLMEDEVDIHEVEVPITQREIPEVPPPPIPEVIEVVEDETDLLEELVIDVTETSEDEFVNWTHQEEVVSVETEEEETDEVLNFELVERVPVFPGCEDAVNNDQRKACFQSRLMQYVLKNFKYPEAAREMNIQGKVYVHFVVEKDGNLSNIEVVRGVDPILDEEALRVIHSLPHIKPAEQRGKPVRMSFVLPINARLQR